MVAFAANFQISSCTIEENGILGGFADLFALGELRDQLFELSPLAGWFDDCHGPWRCDDEGEGEEEE